MAEVHVARPTPAADPAWSSMERELHAAMARVPRYPDGTEFVPADLPFLGRVLDRAAHEGRTVVLVYPDGHEHLLAFRRSTPPVTWLRSVVAELLRSARQRRR